MHEPEVPPSSQMRFRAEPRTRWNDDDRYGVLNNAVYTTLFEEARLAYFESLGIMQDDHSPFFLLQANVRFLAPGRGGQCVTVEAATVALGTKSISQAYRVRGADGSAWCEAEAVLVTVDTTTMTSQPMSARLRAAVADWEAGRETPG
ncbi:MAG: acyl-CoA thioesterase [bacterium]|nr:acyl-CoA thioesterase [bacterium]